MKYEIIIIIIFSFQLHSDETTNNIYCTKSKFSKLLKSIVICKYFNKKVKKLNLHTVGAFANLIQTFNNYALNHD